MEKIKPHKILFICHKIAHGGAERQIVEMCQGFNKKFYEISVIIFYHQKGYLEDLRNTKVKITILSTRKRHKWETIPKLINYLNTNKFDLIHTILPIPNFVGGFLGKLATNSFIISSLRTSIAPSKLNIFYWLNFLSFHFFSDILITNSNEGKKCAVERYNVNPNRIFVIHNGKNIDNFDQNKKNNLRQEIGVKENCKIITTIGRLTKAKGHIYLVECARILLSQNIYHDFAFLIVGKPEDEYDNIKLLISEYGLSKNVKLLGIRDDIANILINSDVFVFPSLWEGIPNALLEAMIAEVPVVVSNFPSCKEIVKHRDSGLIFQKKDVKKMSAHILEIINNKSLAASLKINAKNLVRTKFSLDKMVKQHDKIYSRFLH